MALSKLLSFTEKVEQINSAAALLREPGKNCQIEGLSASSKPFVTAAIQRVINRPMLVVTYSTEQAESFYSELQQFIGEEGIYLFPANEGLPFEDVIPDYHIISQRIAAMDALLKSIASIVVTPIHALLRRILPVEELKKGRLFINTGDAIDVDQFLSRLVELGYERTETVDRHGEFSKRGGIIDVYASTSDYPIRIELFGDNIESIRSFEIVSQRSVASLQFAEILPSREVILQPEMAKAASERIKKDLDAQLKKLGEKSEAADKLRYIVETHYTHIENLAYFNAVDWYVPYLYPDEHTLLEYLPKETVIVWDEPAQIRSHWQRMLEENSVVLADHCSRGEALESSFRHFVNFDHFAENASNNYQGVYLSLIPRPVPRTDITHHFVLDPTQADFFGGKIDLFTEQLRTWVSHGCKVVIATAQEKRLIQLLDENDIHAFSLEEWSPSESSYTEGKSGCVLVASAGLHSGFRLNEAQLIVLTDEEIFGITKLHRPRRVFREGVPISSILDLKQGDYVVHINHGIGIYRGLVTLNTLGVERDFLLLEYAGEDKLYVPTDQIDRVQKYIGGEAIPPVVHRLGGAEWARTTKRVKQSVREMAKELIDLYAQRQALGGHAYSEDTPWQQEMESAFPYIETPDQQKAIADVKRDLEEPKSMDRLICGDVGFGKTEVAIRAAFKVVQDGKQVAVLCPTTVLAQQHWNTFRERLAAFPITIEMLSRFRKPKEIKSIVQALKVGAVDIVIGTHRLLSKDIEFKDLGLVIIDEEQRFGVSHKEKLKQLRKTVDCLAMSATPIPRTLHMALSGIRDMSVINDPPEGRRPVKTYIHQDEDSVIREAIVRELDRDGQVYVVHNRIDNITYIAERIRKLVPYARIEIAHGQMDEDELERVMLDFYDHKFDVLVCTTIIENGLDIPNVNTIIIFDSDKMGLSQLYQLRGRVGRSDRQAYAYLLYKREKALTEAAEKRIDAIREFSELGSGFRIALRDLEIRGAGNLLGAEQHGQANAVGFDLYCRLLADAVSELRGEEKEEFFLPPVELPIDAHIPSSYISNEAQRIYFYKRMQAVKNVNEVQDIQDELEDRFGDPPRPVWNALSLLRLRFRCLELGIFAISHDRGRVQLLLQPGIKLPDDILRELARQHRRHQWLPDRAFLNLQNDARILSSTEDMVEVLGKAISRIKKSVKVN